MKRAVLAVGVALFLAVPVAAQWLGQPIWNSPMGGTGITIYGDYGKPNTDAGQGSAVGGRVALGSGSVTLTLGVASWKPEAFSSRVISYGGTMAARLIGGSLLPVAVNLQVGGAQNPKVTSGTRTWPETKGAAVRRGGGGGGAQRAGGPARNADHGRSGRRPRAPWPVVVCGNVRVPEVTFGF